MATVTVYTAQRMKAIEDNAIIDGDVVDDELILKRYDQSTINAGNVRGPQGVQGVPGPAQNPPGTIIMGGWSVSPEGYLLLNGGTVLGGVITYPHIATMFPSWVSANGSDLILPNADQAVPMGGGTPGVVSGSMQHTLSTANMPYHRHNGPIHSHTGPSHAHSGPSHRHGVSGTTGSDGTHTHDYSRTISNAGASATGIYPFYNNIYSTPTTSAGAHTHSFSANSSYAGNGATGYAGTGTTGLGGTGLTGPSGDNNPVNHTPKNITVRYAVKI